MNRKRESDRERESERERDRERETLFGSGSTTWGDSSFIGESERARK